MYLLRNNKIEFEGNKKDIINYIKESYYDDYFVEQYSKIFNKDHDKFIYCLQNLGLVLSTRKPRR